MTFNATYSDPIFTQTEVLHSNRVSVNFNPPIQGDKKTWDNIFFNYDAAATINGSLLRFYNCEETIREIDCVQTGDAQDLHDTSIQEDWTMMKQGIFSGYKLIAGAASHHNGGTRKLGETRVYILSRNGDVQT